ncbi:MAG: lamin tail domain-containing protein [Candidatus Pacebacteria bacterium]|nr:lamin tail domain-containing protein [Candidatus Paceibacterota bacterium]
MLLILSASFLFSTNECLADNLDEINIENLNDYLELPQKDIQELVWTLGQIFTNESISLWGSGYATDEEIAASVILLKVTKIEALNHLLVDAPLDIIFKITKTALEITKFIEMGDILPVLEKIEKESVDKAIAYGVNELFKSDIKVTPGAMRLRYPAREGKEKEILLQYVMIFHPLQSGGGDIKIKFYSPNPVSPPNSQKFGKLIQVPNLTKDLSPFIVEVEGSIVKNEFNSYRWTSKPTMTIEFPSEVPDLGIKPLSFWEKKFLKPIEGTIKEVEIIITRVTGKSPGLVELWGKVKDFLAQNNPFSPAALVDNSPLDRTLGEVQKEGISFQTDRKENSLLSTEAEKGKEGNSAPEGRDVLSPTPHMPQEVIEVEPQEESQSASAQEETEDLLEKEPGTEKQEEEIVEEAQEITETILKDESGLCIIINEARMNSVIFNEIAWMGTMNSANDEWFELKNISDEVIDLSDWQILDKEKQIKIEIENKTIQPNGFLIFERTDDDSMPHLTADFIYTGALNDAEEGLYLFDNNCQLMDSAEANPQWPAGEKSTRRSMERNPDLSWHDYSSSGFEGILGTPKNDNSRDMSFLENLAPPLIQIVQDAQEETLKTVTESPYAPPSLFITEVQIDSAISSNYDFVEIYNPSTSSIDISGFKLRKRNSNSNEFSVRVFAEGSAIPSQGYFVWANSEYVFSNGAAANITSSQSLSKDSSIGLFDKEGNIIDALAWGSSTDPFTEGLPFLLNPGEDQSVGRKWATTTQSYIDDGNNFEDFELQEITPGLVNWKNPEEIDDVELPINDATNTEANSSDSVIEIEEIPSLLVVVNEIGWMGTSASSTSDEWIELYNNTTSTIDLAGWQLSFSSNTINFSTTSSIGAGTYFLLERTDDNSVSNIKADYVYTGALKNNGEKLELRDANGLLVDFIDCSSGWFAGTTSQRYISMERIVSTSTGSIALNWANNNQITANGLDANGDKIYGTPKNQNSVSKNETEIGGIIDYPALTYFGSPYIILNTLDIPGSQTLTIEPGVVLKLGDLGNISISGTLKAVGQEDNKIIFTSLGGEFWNGIYFAPSGTNSEMAWVEIKGAERSSDDHYQISAVLVKDSSVLFKNSNFGNYRKIGLRLLDSNSIVEEASFSGPGVGSATKPTIGIEIEGGSPIIKNCNSINNNRWGIFVKSLKEGNVPFIEGNNFNDNLSAVYALYPSVIFKSNHSNKQEDRISISGYLISDATWGKNDFPYYITQDTASGININQGKTLTIDPGVSISFSQFSKMTVEGALSAQGSAEGRISIYGDEGVWQAMYFTQNSVGSILENVMVQDGIDPWKQGQINVKGSSIIFRNSTSTNSKYAGIYLENSISTIQDSYFGDNKTGIEISGSESFPELKEGIVFENNKSYDIFLGDTANQCILLPEYLQGSRTNCL